MDIEGKIKYDKMIGLLERMEGCLSEFKLDIQRNYLNLEFRRHYPNFAKYWVDNEYGELKEVMTLIGGYIWKDV